MDAAAIEEANKLRVSMGMKPLPVPGASGPSDGPQFKDKADTSDGEDPASTLETREAASYGNYKKVQDAELAKKRREEKAAAIRKARDAVKRSEKLEGKGLGDLDGDDVDAKSWLVGQKKRQKKIDAERKKDDEATAAKKAAAAAVQYTSQDLAGVKVRHEVDAFEDGDEQILTLADKDVLAEDDDGDELENVDLRDREKLNERLNLKKKKPVYDPHEINETGESNLLAQYDDEISGKKINRFTLDGQGSTAQSSISQIQQLATQNQKINLDILEDLQPASDYLDVSEIKVKKPKKKKSKATRQRPLDDDDILNTPIADDQSMDVDSGPVFLNKKRKTEESDVVDDEDLQAALAVQRRGALKKRKKVRPEDIARQIREDADKPEPDDEVKQDAGLVIDEISEFVTALTKEDIEKRKAKTAKSPQPETVTAMEEDSDEDQAMKNGDDVEGVDEARAEREISAQAEVTATGVEEEKTLGTGIGTTLQLLRERRLVSETGSGELNDQFRSKQSFLAEKRRRMEQMDQATKNQRERDRQGGRLDRMSVQEREAWARQQNSVRDQQASRQLTDLFRDYKPNVDLKYVDDDGRLLSSKDAFKHLSHAFHGKGSGKGKTDKRLKKIEDEKRHEAQSVLDASQNVGMSSATAHQTKTRREAGVRLA
ncbi:SART-1 protein [Xylariaceae sp. FL1019]|nr:SART-1 protein [Xylariaceae sp. FL1019]